MNFDTLPKIAYIDSGPSPKISGVLQHLVSGSGVLQLRFLVSMQLIKNVAYIQRVSIVKLCGIHHITSDKRA